MRTHWMSDKDITYDFIETYTRKWYVKRKGFPIKIYCNGLIVLRDLEADANYVMANMSDGGGFVFLLYLEDLLKFYKEAEYEDEEM